MLEIILACIIHCWKALISYITYQKFTQLHYRLAGKNALEIQWAGITFMYLYSYLLETHYKINVKVVIKIENKQ